MGPSFFLEKRSSEKKPTPFWRVVDPKSNLAKKLGCGSKFIRDMRALEAD